jgi:hypothetical protein
MVSGVTDWGMYVELIENVRVWLDMINYIK